MKIAIDVSEAYIQDRTGPGNYVYNFLQAMSRIGSDNEYHLYHHSGCLGSQDTMNNSFSMHHVNAPVNRTLWSQVLLPYAMRKEKYDVVHVPGHRMPLHKRHKTVITIFDLAYIYFRDCFKPMHYARLKYFTERSLSKADRIIAISESTKQDIVREYHINPDKINVVYLGVDPTQFPVIVPEVVSDIKKKHSLKDEYIVHVGTMQPRKNLMRLIAAFDAIKGSSHADLQLVLIGKKGWMYKDIFSLVQELHLERDVILLDYVDNNTLSGIMRGAKALVYPSLYEGFGLPILEAFSCGLPVIASRSSSLPEIGGDAVIYFDPYNTDEIIHAISELLEDADKRAEMAQKGRERVNLFSWEKTARETIEAYEKVQQ